MLSACETALGERTSGDEIVGLTRAFLGAGSRAVLSTLWSIDDQASMSLMTRFYELLSAGGSAAASLRAAQLESLARLDHRAPYYWAAFILTSGGQPLPAP